MKKRHTITILTVLLIMLTEYEIMNWTRDFGADKEVVSHVGFAGTIVSIVLAVIAIFYSFYQTFAQQQDSASLGERLRNLGTVSDTLKNSSLAIDEQQTQLASISAQLQETLAASRRAEQTLGSLQQDLAKIALVKERTNVAEATAGIAANASDSGVDRGMAATQLAAAADPMQLGVYVGINYASAAHLGLRQFGSLIARAANKKLTSQGKAEIASALSEWYEGIAMGHLEILGDLKLITKRIDQTVTPAKIFFTAADEFRQAVERRRREYQGTPPDRYVIDVESIENEIAIINEPPAPSLSTDAS